jgi:NAD(P)-dependent dehydrogenase (short-subunit alcohol dehydrogenase family)
MHLCLDDYLAGRWDEAEELALEGQAVCEASGFAFFAWYFWYNRAVIAAGRGRFDEAYCLADDMTHWALPRGVAAAAQLAQHPRALAALGQGDWDAAFRHAEQRRPARSARRRSDPDVPRQPRRRRGHLRDDRRGGGHLRRAAAGRRRQRSVPGLAQLADGGAIVNITSTSAGSYGLEPGYSAYGTMKGGLVVLTRYLARELGARGIRVNSVSPGSTRTRIGGDAFERYPEVIPGLAARTVLGRLGEPDDIGMVVAALLGEECRWITAQDIEVSGGFNL